MNEYELIIIDYHYSFYPVAQINHAVAAWIQNILMKIVLKCFFGFGITVKIRHAFFFFFFIQRLLQVTPDLQEVHIIDEMCYNIV